MSPYYRSVIRNVFVFHLFSSSLIGSSSAISGVQDDRFRQYIEDACTLVVTVPVTQQFLDICAARNQNSSGSGTPLFSLNVGTSSSQNRIAFSNKGDQDNPIEERLEELQKEKGGGAAGDETGLGFLFSVQQGKTERVESLLESGFDSDLTGLTVGVDYGFADAFVLGVALSKAKDEGIFVAGTGKFSTETTSAIAYGTWLMSNAFTVDFYVGSATSDSSNSRDVVFGSLGGVVNSVFDSSQTMLGTSINYDTVFGDTGLGVFLSIDKIDTTIDPYTETGLDPNTGTATLVELVFPQQNIESFTTSIGFRLDHSMQFDWGVLVPGFQYAVVDENKNDKRFINAALPYAPDYFFVIETDDPDRRYSFQTLSLVMVTNDGLQGFVNIEQRAGHRFIDDTSYTVGLLYQY